MLELLHNPNPAAVICAFTFVSALFLHGYLRFKTRRYPPGPRGDPIIGNIRSMPGTHAYRYYTQLKKTYGDVVYLQAMGKDIVLLGSYEAVNQFLVKRSLIYSERPRFPVFDQTLGLNLHPPLSPMGPKWKEERRLFHLYLGKDVIQTQYRNIIESHAQQYALHSLGLDKTSSTDYLKTMALTTLRVIYGIEVKSDDDEYLRVAMEGMVISSPTIIPGRHMANSLPALMNLPEWFPGASWKREGRMWKELLSRMIVNPFNRAKIEESEGTSKESFVASLLRNNTTLDENQIMFASGATFLAGAETTAGVVQHLIYAMLLYPEIQAKAQEEIDTVVGRDRLPTLADYANLPFVQALYKESLRWRPVAPFPIPHEATKTAVVDGWVIPKGTMIIANNWALAMDEKVYAEPEKFTPGRFLGTDPEMDPRLFVFGVGRRICPGMAFGESIVLATLLTLLATVDIVKATDANGHEIPISPETTGKLADLPLPFEFKLIARSEAATALLHSAVAA